MKKVYSLVAVCAVSLLCLTSCDFFTGLFSSDSGDNNISKPTSTENLDKTRSWTSYIDNTKMLSNQGISALSSTGEQKILVVPVSFNSGAYDGFQTFYDQRFPTSKGKTYQETLYDVFFGESEDTGFESVRSYYAKSSYGKLNFSGEILDEVKINSSMNYYESLISAGRDLSSVVNNLTEDIFKKIYRTNVDLAEYDQNNDGVLDAVWFVYNEEMQAGADLAWAFTTTNQNLQSKFPYKIGTFSWASYWFTDEGVYRDSEDNFLPDSHTYVHETGHILGLTDYYSYDNLSYAPVGGLDMMDFNIGDHMAMTKYLLNWIDPKEIVTAGTYTLKPLDTSGEAFILANGFNGTTFDEYLMLEYYTPTGLNYQDSVAAYNNGYQMFSKSGLRIYHVDLRVGFVNSNGDWNGHYVENINSYATRNEYLYVIASNTPSQCYETADYRYVELVSPRYNGKFSAKKANNSDIFGVDDSLVNYAFNDSSSLPFSLTVTNLDENSLTIAVS